MNTRNLLSSLDHQRATGRIALPLGFWTRSAMVGTLIAGAGIASLIDPPHGMQFLLDCREAADERPEYRVHLGHQE